MTEKEYQNLMVGDAIFNLKKNEGYVVIGKHDNYLSYQGVPWPGSFPKKTLLHCNYIALTKHEDFTDNENIKKARSILMSIVGQPNIAEEENRCQLRAKIWNVINLISGQPIVETIENVG